MPTQTTPLEELRQSLPEAAKDLKLNLQSVLRPQTLSPAQRWGTAVGAACFVRCPHLRDALVEEAGEQDVGENVIEDARAAAALMAMNTVYYRFRHMVGKDSYNKVPARLRMNRMARPASGKADFELFALAAAALAGCETCIKAHEASILKQGLTEQHVHEAVRIAATMHGVAVALENA